MTTQTVTAMATTVWYPTDAASPSREPRRHLVAAAVGGSFRAVGRGARGVYRGTRLLTQRRTMAAGDVPYDYLTLPGWGGRR